MVLFNTDMDNPVDVHFMDDSLENYKVVASSSAIKLDSTLKADLTLDGASALLLCKR